MLGKLIGWTFDLLGRLWDGFWNATGKLIRLLAFTAFCGVVGAMIAKFADLPGSEVWYFAKCGIFIGLLVGGIKMLIDEVAVPLVHAQTNRERMRRRKEADHEFAKARAISRQESLSNRLKHLN